MSLACGTRKAAQSVAPGTARSPRQLLAAPAAASTSSAAAPAAPQFDAAPPDAGQSLAGDAAAALPGEHWRDDLRSDESCRDYRTDYALSVYTDPHGPNRKYGYDGYGYREVEVSREIDGILRKHCVRVYHPRDGKNAQKRRVHVAEHIGPAWYRLIERTLSRIPWRHLQQVQAVVIDDRPLLHGVAPFNRQEPSKDARDGHTIWLHERLFEGMNHWASGNYGKYWAYQVQLDGVKVEGQAADHELFSPVLLHEIGHLVNYNVLNGSASDPTCPPCAQMCGDRKDCGKLDAAAREAPCATAYCTGFGHESGTENWAEMYRWYYQGSATRDLLARSFPACSAVFEGNGSSPGINDGLAAPWDRGLGQSEGYHRTLWSSCQEKPCKDR